MTLLVAVLVTFVAAVIASMLIPRDVIRGVSVSLTIGILLTAWTPVVPATIRECAIWCSCVVLFVSSLGVKRWKTNKDVQFALVLLFFVVAMVTTSVRSPETIGALIRLGMLAILVTFVVGNFSPRDTRALYVGLILVGVAQVAFGTYEAFVSRVPALWGFGVNSDGTLVTYVNPFLGDGFGRTQGTTGHPIIYGTLMAIALVIVIANWANYKKGWRACLLILLGGGLVLSGTRSAVLALVVGLCYCLLLSTGSRSRPRNYLFAGLIAAGVLVLDFGLARAVDQLLQSGSFTNRASGIESVPGLLARGVGETLFGSGHGSESSLFARGYLQQNGFNVVDNQLVTTLATGGVVGFLLLVAIVGYGFRKGDRIARSLIIGMIVMMFSFDFLRWPGMLCMLFAFVALPRLSSSSDEEVHDSFDYTKGADLPRPVRR